MVLQLTTRNNHRIAIEPTHVSAVSEFVNDQGELLTTLHTANGSHEVIEAFEKVYEEWQSQLPADDVPGDADDADIIATIQDDIRALPMPTTIPPDATPAEIFNATKAAIIEALAALE